MRGCLTTFAGALLATGLASIADIRAAEGEEPVKVEVPAEAVVDGVGEEVAAPPAGKMVGEVGKEQAGSAADGTGLTAEQRAFWEEFSGKEGIKIQQEEALAESLFLEARSLLQQGRFIEAKEKIDRAIQAFPYHQAAQRLRQDINGILNRRSDRLQMASNWLAAIGAVTQQEKAIELQALLEKGDKSFQAGYFQEAFLAYDRVAIAIASFPYEFDWGDLPSEVEAKKLQAQARAREKALSRDREARVNADELSRIRQQMEEDVLKQRIDAILERAELAFKRQLYRRAAVDAFNAYQLDRRRDDARRLYLEARRLSHVQFDDDYRERRLEQLARVNEQIHIGMIPQDELLVFPEDWFRRSLRTAEDLTEAVTESWRDQIKDKLQQEIAFVWEENTLEEVIDFLQRMTDVNYVVEPRALTSPDIPPITLSGRMRLETVLNWIVQLTDLRMAIRNEAIYFSTEEVVGALQVRMYNITDLITPVTNFPGPELAYSAGGGGGGGGGGGFGLWGGDGDDGDAQTLDAEAIEEIIRSTVMPTSWEIEGANITYRDGSKTLFITQSPEVHLQVHDLLRHLRNQSSLQVKIQIRILDVEKNFLEEIGVEWNDRQATDLLSNRFSNVGYFDANPEWNLNLASSNRLPETQAQNGFVDQFGNGLRMNYIWSNNAGTLFDLRTINTVLEAVENESDSQIVNAPELTCFNGQRANATFINQFAYISDYDVGGEDNYDPVIDVINFGDIIDIKPLVSADLKYITLEVRPSSVLLQDVFVEEITTVRTTNNIRFISDFPLELPNVEVRTLRSTITLPDKGSLMLGGYTRGLRQRTHSGIPFLSHIPFLGRLFSKNGIYDENRTIMFLIQGEIVDMSEREELQ